MTPQSESTPGKLRRPSGSAEPDDARPSENLHLTTFTHDGRFWDVYLEFVEAAESPDSCRAKLCYVPADRPADVEPARTAVIIIEASCEEAIEKARALDRYNLVALLRSAS